MKGENIAHTLVKHATMYPQRTAIIESVAGRDMQLTFAELERATGRAANLLKRYGLQQGDVVLVFQPMSSELYIILLALFRLGMVAMFLDPSAGRKHIEKCCEIAKPKGFIATGKAHLLRLFSASIRRIKLKSCVGHRLPLTHDWNAWRNEAYANDIVPCGAAAPALLTFTSGSTGRPKVVMRSHRFLLKQHTILKDAIALRAGQRDLATLPIFVLANLASGVTSIIPEGDLLRPGFIEPLPVLKQMERLKPDRAVAAPAFFARLLEADKAQPSAFASLRQIYTGGGPTEVPFLERLDKRANHAKVIAVYGSTEAEPIAHMEVAAMIAMGATYGQGIPAGEPVEAIQCRVIQDRWGTPIQPMHEAIFAQATLGVEEIGEIVVSGECVVKGYYDGYGDEDTKFQVDGVHWHRTGDAGFFDKHGCLWLVGRCQGAIDIQGSKVYPFQVETLAHPFAEIRRCALCAVNQVAVLAVELIKHVELKQRSAVTEHLKAVLAEKGYHDIEVEVVKYIPVDKRHNSKVDYTRLQRLWSAITSK